MMYAVLLGLSIWLAILTFLLLRMVGHYNKLGAGISKSGLKDVLESLLVKQNGLTKKTEDLEKAIKVLAHDGELHIQKIGMIRFNPFADTGGAQSFTIALLDAENHGLVMTSLYARTGNRWYVKQIAGGKGKGFELSKEEVEAIKNAQRGGNHE